MALDNTEDVSVRLNLLNALTFKREMDGATASTRRFGGASKVAAGSQRVLAASMGKTNKALLAATRHARDFAVVGLAAGAYEAKRMVTAASNLHEQITKASVVFRGSERDILSWSTNTANSLGLSQRAALEAAGTFGNMLVPMGIGRQKAEQMSKTLVRLGADMASFNNVSLEDSLMAIRSGIAGETEPLRRLGVDLRVQAVQEFAAAQGIKKSWQQIDGKTKSMLLYQKILHDTADAQGDFQRTSTGAANQGRILQANIENLEAGMGQALLPTLNKGAIQLNKWLTNANKSGQAAKTFEEGLDSAVSTGRTAYNTLKPFAKLLWEVRRPLAIVAGLWVSMSLAMGAVNKASKGIKSLKALWSGGTALAKGKGLGGFADRGNSPLNPVFVAVVDKAMNKSATKKALDVAKKAAPAAATLSRAATSAALSGAGLAGAYGLAGYVGYRMFLGPRNTPQEAERQRAEAARQQQEYARRFGNGRTPILDAQGFPTGKFKEAQPDTVINVQVDGRTLATAVHRAATKERALR